MSLAGMRIEYFTPCSSNASYTSGLAKAASDPATGVFCNRRREELAFGPAVDADMTAGEGLGKEDDERHRVLTRISAHEVPLVQGIPERRPRRSSFTETKSSSDYARR